MATITVKCVKCKQPMRVAVWANGKGTSLFCQCGKTNSVNN